jgi:hypothetical protein
VGRGGLGALGSNIGTISPGMGGSRGLANSVLYPEDNGDRDGLLDTGWESDNEPPDHSLCSESRVAFDCGSSESSDP